MNLDANAIDGHLIAKESSLEDRSFWVGLRLAGIASSSRWMELQERYGSGQAVWEASDAQLRAVLGNREKQLAGLLKVRTKLDPIRSVERLLRDGVHITTIFDEGYPTLLREIGAPPPVLFHRGTLLETDALAVSIVGTRAATAYGRDMARSLAHDLARAGVTIVSGLARGIDGIAHQAALDAGGRTLAVLGSGIHDIYPREHRGLAKHISEQGAVISDNVPDAKPDRWNFPARNRIISGLSRGVIVVEAPEKSGALITVDFAADQGRDVFAVPGPVHATASAGCNQMLRDGARLVRRASDVLDDLLLFATPPIIEPVSQPGLLLEEDDRRVLGLLTTNPMHIDDVVDASGLLLPRVSAILLSLELQQLVNNTGAQHYIRR